jgi:transposase
MFVKKSKSRNGRFILTYTYGYRENGKVKHKNYETIGYLDELEKIHDDPIAHFKQLAKSKFKDFDPADKSTILLNLSQKLSSDLSIRKNIGYFFLNDIYHSLSIKSNLDLLQSNHNVSFNFNDIFKLLVFSRILFPASKKATLDNQSSFFENFNISKDSLYRSLSYFCDNKHSLLSTLFNSTKDVYNRDTSTTYYDCTNYYFEISYNDEDLIDEEGLIIEKGLRKKGVSKEHRKSPIVQMGLLMDSSGLPVSYDIFPGNESEKLSLRPILKKTKRDFNIQKTIVVADRGINTSDNTFFLSGKNDCASSNSDGYIYGQSIIGASEEFKAWAIDNTDFLSDVIYDKDGQIQEIDKYVFDDDGTFITKEKVGLTFKHKSRTIAKTITIKKDGKRSQKTQIYQKQLIYYSQKYANRQKMERSKMIAKAKDMIENPQKYTKATTYGASGYVNNLSFDKDSGEIIDSKLSLKTNKIMEEQKYDGYYAIVTSEIEMSDVELKEKYSGLWKIEETFKITKSNLETRPVYVWTRESIEAHFLTCFVALLIVRLLEKKSNRYSITKLVEATKNISAIYLEENIYMIDYRDEVIEHLERLFGYDFSNKFIHKKKLEKFIKK